MSENTAEATELTSQYSAQVASDLERNIKEQERLSGEIEALQAQLAALQHDRAVLGNIQQALGISTAVTPAAEPAASVPAPRKKASGATKQTKGKKTSTGPLKRAGKKSADTPTASSSASPTLVDLVREHLAGQSEPRSAAEITAALEQRYPDRTVKTTVVRTTLEGLVAKAQAERSRQGRSVFYTAASQQAGAPEAEAQPNEATS